MYTQRLSEALAIVATIDPDAYTTGAENTDVVDMMNHRRSIWIVTAGTLGSSATVDFGVYGDTSSGGSFTTLITGKSITQLTEAGTDDDKQAIVEVTAEEANDQGFRYLRGTLTVGVATSDAGAIALADVSRHTPASAFDLATVAEIVA